MFFPYARPKRIGPVLRGRVCPPRFLSTRSGEDNLLLGYHLAMSHPNLAAEALHDPHAMDSMRSEYLSAVDIRDPDSFRLPECWWTAGHLEQELYRRLVKDANARWAPKPRYEDVPGISTGNVTTPRRCWPIVTEKVPLINIK